MIPASITKQEKAKPRVIGRRKATDLKKDSRVTLGKKGDPAFYFINKL